MIVRIIGAVLMLKTTEWAIKDSEEKELDMLKCIIIILFLTYMKL